MTKFDDEEEEKKKDSRNCMQKNHRHFQKKKTAHKIATIKNRNQYRMNSFFKTYK